MKRLLCALFFPLLSLFAFADGGLPTQPYIYVEGKAEIEKPADMVTLSFTLAAMNPDQAAANKEVQEKAAMVFKLLESTKIERNDIVAGDLQVHGEYENDEGSSSSRGKFVGYSVVRPFEVKVREVGKFPKLVDDLLAINVAEFSGIQEGLKDAKEIQDQVWEKAVINARERADKTLKAAGMKVDSVFAISPVAFPEIRRRLLDDPEQGRMNPVAAGPAELDIAHYRLAPVTVSQNVHLIYLISPVK